MTTATTDVAPLIELDYSAADGRMAREVVVLFRQLLVVAVLSGFCVASCFLVFSSQLFGVTLHALVYVAILTTAVLAGRRMALAAGLFPAVRSRARICLDLLATVGLVIIGFGPLLHWVLVRGGYLSFDENGIAAVLAVAFGLLAATGYRHVLQYRAVANMVGAVGANRGGLVGLGWVKCVIETIWLTTCFVGLAAAALENVMRNAGVQSGEGLAFVCAFAALFGIPVYGVLWLVMIGFHIRCLVVINRAAMLGYATGPDATPRGFEPMTIETTAKVG
ncbi:MAG TPA: hypothetical protein VF595_01055 [Tepidisphaeraceae bacterium]|jgi:hypothetical protein